MDKPIVAALIILVGILILEFYLYVDTFGYRLSENQELWGQFGDFFGGTLNPAFAFLTIVILLRSLYIQNETLKETINEYKETSKAINQQNKNFTDQNKRERLLSLIDNIYNEIEKEIHKPVEIWCTNENGEEELCLEKTINDICYMSSESIFGNSSNARKINNICGYKKQNDHGWAPISPKSIENAYTMDDCKYLLLELASILRFYKNEFCRDEYVVFYIRRLRNVVVALHINGFFIGNQIMDDFIDARYESAS